MLNSVRAKPLQSMNSDEILVDVISNSSRRSMRIGQDQGFKLSVGDSSEERLFILSHLSNTYPNYIKNFEGLYVNDFQRSY